MQIDKIEEYQNDSLYDELRDDVFDYLEELRESGETNMFGAVPYIQEAFQIDKNIARKFLLDWIEVKSDA